MRRSLALPNERSRRRPMLYALLGAYGLWTLGAWLAALPLVNAATASGITGFPEGDARLFDPGLLLLLDALAHERASLLASGDGIVAVFALSALGGIAIEWWLLRACCRLRAPLGRLEPAPARLAHLAAWSALTWLLRALVWVVALAIGLALRSHYIARTEERTGDLLFVSLLGLGLIAQLGLSAIHDLCAARLVSSVAQLGASFGRAIEAVRRTPLGLGARYAVYRASTLGLLLAAAALGSALGDTRAHGWGLLACFTVHQCAISAGLGLRALWLSSALSAVSP